MICGIATEEVDQLETQLLSDCRTHRDFRPTMRVGRQSSQIDTRSTGLPLFRIVDDHVELCRIVSSGEESGAHWIATRARSWWNQTGPNAIHPVSRYCDVIVKDLTLICVILTKLVNCKRVDGSGRIAVFIGRFLWGWP